MGLTHAQLLERMRSRWPWPEWAMVTEAGLRTRRADAIALNLWSSRGQELHGFEIKTDRRDWLRELKEPAKADEMAAYCERWWIVAGDADIVRPEEMPPTWGLVVPHGKTLKVVLRGSKQKAKPMGRAFVAMFVSKMYDYLVNTVSQEDIRKAFEEGRKEEREHLAAAARTDDEFIAKMRALMGAYTTQTRYSLTWENPARVAACLRFVLVHGGGRDGTDILHCIASEVETLQKSVEQARMRIAEAARAVESPSVGVQDAAVKS